MSEFESGLINGICMGSVFALIALGYTMVYGIVKMINFAHGEFIVVGGFTLYGVSRLVGPSWWGVLLSVVCAVLACVLVSFLTEKFAYKPLRKKSSKRINALITAIGVSYILYGIVNLISNQSLTPPVLFNIESKIGKMIFLVSVTAVCLILLTIFVKKTKLGKATRAVSENPEASKLMGINNNVIIALTFIIGAIMAAISATLFYTYNNVSLKFSDGTLIIGLIPFAAAVVGGIGSLPGAVIGGMIIGLIQEFVYSYQLGSWNIVFIYGILILVLLIKPSGILGKEEGEKV